MTTTLCSAAASQLILAAASSISAWAQNADTILINGKILTADAQFSIQQALAVRDGKIEAVGTNAAIRKAAGPKSQVIDLGGRTVIPGLIDSHMHAHPGGVVSCLTEVNWAGDAARLSRGSRSDQAVCRR